VNLSEKRGEFEEGRSPFAFVGLHTLSSEYAGGVEQFHWRFIVVMSGGQSEEVALLSGDGPDPKGDVSTFEGDDGLFDRDEHNSRHEAGKGAIEKGDDVSASAAPELWHPRPEDRVFVFAKLLKKLRRCPGYVVEIDEPCFARKCGCDKIHVERGPNGPTGNDRDLIFVETDARPTVAIGLQDLRRMQSYAVGQTVLDVRGELQIAEHFDQRANQWYIDQLAKELRFHGLTSGQVSLARAPATVNLKGFSVSNQGQCLEAIVQDVKSTGKRAIDVRELQGKVSPRDHGPQDLGRATINVMSPTRQTRREQGCRHVWKTETDGGALCCYVFWCSCLALLCQDSWQTTTCTRCGLKKPDEVTAVSKVSRGVM
jgi:hypothetical protein